MDIHFRISRIIFGVLPSRDHDDVSVYVQNRLTSEFSKVEREKIYSVS